MRQREAYESRVRDPTSSTIRQLFASQFACAHPDCGRPLVDLDTHGNRTIVADIAHILAASPDGPRPWTWEDHSEEEIRGFDNLVLLCKEHHRIIDQNWEDYSADTLRAWKADATNIVPTGISLSSSDIAAALERLEAHLVSDRYTEQPLSLGPATYQIERLMNDHLHVVDRALHLQALNAFLGNEDSSRLLICQPMGKGKTALLVEWVRQLRATGKWNVVYVPISQRYQTAEKLVTLGQLAYELALVNGESLRRSDLSPDWLPSIVAEFLSRTVGRVVVVLDGLDEVLGWKLTSECFPAQMPTGLKLIMSTREEAGMSRDDWLDQLGWSADTSSLPGLGPLGRDAVVDVLQSTSDLTSALATESEVVSRILEVSEGDPLFVRVIIDDLRDHSITPDQLSEHPPGLKAYFKRALEHVSEQADSEAVYDLLGLCATAKGPLTRDDLAALAPQSLGRANRQVTAVQQVPRYLIGDGSSGAGYAFGHPQFQELYRAGHMLLDERTAFVNRFCDWGRSCYAVSSLPAYVRRFWVTHLAEAGQWDAMRSVLTSQRMAERNEYQPWAAARYAAEGSYLGYLGDLEILWEHADQTRDGTTAVRCALLAASIHSLAGNLPPRLPALMASVARPDVRWKPSVALAQVDAMPDSESKSEALVELAAAVPALSTTEVLRVVETLSPQGRALALSRLGPHLPDALLADALGLAGAIDDEECRAVALSGLGPHLPDALLADALGLAGAIDDEQCRAVALSELGPHLPDALLADALELAGAIDDSWFRAHAASGLGPHLPDALLADALAAALDATSNFVVREFGVRILTRLAPHLSEPQCTQTLADALDAATRLHGPDGAEALRELAPHLPEPQRTSTLAAALEAATALTLHDAHEHAAHDRAQALRELAPHLPEPLLDDALRAAQIVTDESSRAQALSGLAPYLSDALLADALDSATAISEDESRVLALSGLAPYLPEPKRSSALAGAVAAADAVSDDKSRTRVLTELASQLPEPQRTDRLIAAVRAATTITDDWSRAEALVALGPHLPESQRRKTFADAVDAANRIPNDPSRALTLSRLTPYLTEAQLASTLDLASTIVDDTSRAEAIGRLAARLPDELLVSELDAAYAIADDRPRALMLGGLAPHLPEPQRTNTFVAALDAAIAITNNPSRDRAFHWLTPRLPEELLVTALHAIGGFTDDGFRALALMWLAPRLPDALAADALNVADTVSRPVDRARVLTELVPRLPELQRTKALAEALNIANALTEGIRADQERAYLLRRLAPQFPAAQRTNVLADALDAAYAIADDGDYASALSQLAPQLPEAQRANALADAFASANFIPTDEGRARVLIGLAPQLPEPECIEALGAALEAADAIQDDRSRAQVFKMLAATLVKHTERFESVRDVVLLAVLRSPWRRTRAAVVDAIGAMSVWIAEAVDGAAITQIADAIVDTSRCQWS